MTRTPELDETVSFGEAAAIGRIERALFGGDAELVKVGRYEIIERIGAGAFGRVYRAKDPQLARTIALKVLDVDRGIAHDDLLGEAKVMATVGHPNVAAIFDAGVLAETTPARVFIAMELVVGRNLREWLASPRTVQAIVDVMRQVGQGLAAAHAAGVVHRDVKPENVLVGDDGRVRVVDFGLSRVTAGAVDDDAPITVTRTGTVAGTPAYMAPELFEGAAASAASDQFAYCATMWEALYAARPYGGASIEQLRAAHGRPLPDPPRRPRVPRPITRALERGLARDPAARFASIDALLAELDRARSRRRLAVAALVGTAVLGAGAGVMIARRGTESAPSCARPTAELAGAWDAAAIEKAFAATGDSRAQVTFARASTLADRAMTAWLDAHQDACAATHVRHEQSPALLDRRMTCLRDWRRQFAALGERFAHATPQVIGIATRALAELPPISRCADATELEAGPPRPTDPAIAAKLDELDDKLAKARVQFFAGDAAEALATAELVATEGATLGYEPTQVAALQWRAEALTVLGRYDEARAAAKQCFDLALRIRDHRTASIAASTLAFMGAFDSSRAEESLDWVKTGESLRTKLEYSDDIAGKLAHVEGNIYLTAADAVRAKPALERAIVAWRKLDSEHPNLGPTIAMLGIAEMNTNEMDAAHGHLTEAVQLAERDLGPNHPELASGLINLGLVKGALGKYREAAEVMDRGMALQLAALGDTHPLVGYARLNRGQVAAALGDRARADTELTGAQTVVDATYGPTHAVAVTIALAAGEHYARTGRGDLARTQAKRALDATNALDAAPRALAFATLALAEAVRGDRAAARVAATDARTSLTAAGAKATGSQRQIANDLIGEALLAIGDKQAAEVLRAADQQTDGPPDLLRRARIRLALAKATGDRAIAKSIVLPADIDPALRAAVDKLTRAERRHATFRTGAATPRPGGFMHRIVLVLVLAFGCSKDNSATGEPAREAMGLYAKGFNALIGDPKQMITEYFDNLPDGPQPGSKPRLFPRQNFGTSKITEARDAFAAAKKAAPASLSGLAAPADEALVAIDKIAVTFTAAQKYYDAENYKDDGFAKGQELHAQMVETAGQFRAALNKLEDGLSTIEDQQAIAELAKHESDRGYSYWFRAYNIEAKKFLHAVERAETPEQRATLATAFAPMAKANEELAAFVAAKGKKLNATFKSDVSSASSFDATAVKILRLVKQAKPDEAEHGRELEALVRNYNSLVTMANTLYQLEDADVLN